VSIGLAAVLASLVFASSALAAWSGASQVVGFSQGSNVVTSLDDDGTQQLGFLATGSAPQGQGLYSLTRAPGSTGSATWAAKNVSGPINNGRFAFARNGAGVVAWIGAGNSIWASYRPAGKAWGSPVAIETPPKLGKGPLPVISVKGDAAVVWSRKSDVDLREPDQIRYSATANGTWSAAATLASIELAQPVDEEDFLSCLPGSDLVAAMLPDGSPIVAWNDPYGSFKQEVTNLANPPASGSTELGLCGVKVATTSSTVAVAPSPRPAIGWGATPAGALPYWYPVGIEVDPVSGRTALTVRGNDDAVTDDNAVCDFPGIQESDYCFETAAFQTRVSLGSGSALTHPGTLTANLVRVGLRNGFLAAATSTPAELKAGVGTTFPALSPLSPSAVLTVSAIAVGSKGEAELLIHNGSKLMAYSAPAGGQFGTAADIQTGSQGGVSVAIGCNGDALAAWNRGSSGVFAATATSGAAQCEGSGPNPDPDPGPGTGPSADPPDSGPSAGSQSNAPAGGSATPPVPTPSSGKKPLKCKKGFKKKTVRGTAKCVKAKPKKDKKH